MIFLCDTSGTITAAIPSGLHQGSIGVNKLILLAPFPATTVVTATFTLPNGIKLYPKYVGKDEIEASDYPYIMTVVEAFTGKLSVIDGQSLNVWQLTIDRALTQVSGSVTVQFLFTGADGTLGSSTASLPIGRGNAYLAPTVTEDDLNTISAYLNAAEVAKQKSENAVKLAESYATGEYSWTDEHGITNSVKVAEGEEGYQNNSKYYAEQAYIAAEGAAGSAGAAAISAQEADETAKSLVTLIPRGIQLSMNHDNYTIYAQILDSSGLVISESEIDLPLEQMITDVDYDEATDSLVVTLKNGNKTSIPLTDVINGLVTNLENGEGEGSVQQKGFTLDDGTETMGSKATGDGAVALGGQRYDKAGEDVSEEPQTEAKGKQSFAHGGGVVVEGDWGAGFGKDTKEFQKGGFVTGGGNQVGMSYADYLEYNGLEDTPENLAVYVADIATQYIFGFASGEVNKVLGRSSFIGGGNDNLTKPNARNSFIGGGQGNTTYATNDHAEGYMTEAGTEGETAVSAAHSQNYLTKAKAKYSSASGVETEATGVASSVNGRGTKATEDAQFTAGKYNKVDADALLIIGNGTDDDNRSNAFAVKKDGRVAVGAEPIDDMDVVNKKMHIESIRQVNKSIANRLPIISNETNFAQVYTQSPANVTDTVPGGLNNVPGRMPLSQYVHGETLACRRDTGALRVGTPEEDADAVNLKYFNDNKGGGSKLYLHSIKLYSSPNGDVPEMDLCIKILNRDATSFTTMTGLYNIAKTPKEPKVIGFTCTGYGSDWYAIIFQDYIIASNGNVTVKYNDYNASASVTFPSNTITITDTVTEV